MKVKVNPPNPIKIMHLNLDLLEESFLLATNSLQSEELPSYVKTRWLNALEKARDRLIDQPYFAWQPEQLTIVSIPKAKSKKKEHQPSCRFYQANLKKCCRLDTVGYCQAFFEGFPCWHRAAFLLLSIYFDKLGEIGTDNTQKRTDHTPTVNFG